MHSSITARRLRVRRFVIPGGRGGSTIDVDFPCFPVNNVIIFTHFGFAWHSGLTADERGDEKTAKYHPKFARISPFLLSLGSKVGKPPVRDV